MTPLIPKLIALAGKASDFTGYVFGGGGVIIAAFGAVDANAAQAWIGALAAAIAALWGLYRDQRSNDRKAASLKIELERHHKWTTFITDYRMKQIVDTGKDPFAHGTPPLDFFENVELVQVGRDYDKAAQKTDEAPSPAPVPAAKPAGPKWPNFRHIFG
jgi:hypothetical protein